MNKKHEAKQNYTENNLSKRSGKNRLTLGILFICIIGITSGCLSCEAKQGEVWQMNQVNQESSEIVGEWIGVVDGMDGKPLELKYRFREEGTRLIGLIESQLGGGPISDGKIDGNNIEFSLNTGEFIILNNGTLSGDEIQITQTVSEEKTKYVLKRVKR